MCGQWEVCLSSYNTSSHFSPSQYDLLCLPPREYIQSKHNFFSVCQQHGDVNLCQRTEEFIPLHADAVTIYFIQCHKSQKVIANSFRCSFCSSQCHFHSKIASLDSSSYKYCHPFTTSENSFWLWKHLKKWWINFKLPSHGIITSIKSWNCPKFSIYRMAR